MLHKIKIVLADDHPIVRQGLFQVIENEPDLLISAECGNGEEALAEIEKHEPDVLILDVDMPVMNGFEVLSRLREIGSAVKVILLTVHDEIEFYNEAIRLGASAYILKECAIGDVVRAIRAVASGEIFTGSQPNHQTVSQIDPSKPSGLAALTPMEREILKKIANYQTNKEIGDKLFISPLTVKTHRRNMCIKLNIVGNNALMKFALENKKLL